MFFFFGFYLFYYLVKWFIILTFWMLAAAFIIAGTTVILGAFAAFLAVDFAVQLIRWIWGDFKHPKHLFSLPLIHLIKLTGPATARSAPAAKATVNGAKVRIKAAASPRDWSPRDPDSPK
jgi:hypothetical protein